MTEESIYRVTWELGMWDPARVDTFSTETITPKPVLSVTAYVVITKNGEHMDPFFAEHVPVIVPEYETDGPFWLRRGLFEKQSAYTWPRGETFNGAEAYYDENARVTILRRVNEIVDREGERTKMDLPVDTIVLLTAGSSLAVFGLGSLLAFLFRGLVLLHPTTSLFLLIGGTGWAVTAINLLKGARDGRV
ncbi:MAG TPA: hypothetical protein GX510_03275 [Firmicutes bacterium]|nr:hypothetical protein [Candidatus Fermentithermobacillaceae bacterium]